MEERNSWIKDKTYFLKKYNTERKKHLYTIDHMTETLKRVVEENTLLKEEVEYQKEKKELEKKKRKEVQEKLKEYESSKTH